MIGGAVGVRPSTDGRSDIVVAIALWGGGVVGTDRWEVELVAKAMGEAGTRRLGAEADHTNEAQQHRINPNENRNGFGRSHGRCTSAPIE